MRLPRLSYIFVLLLLSIQHNACVSQERQIEQSGNPIDKKYTVSGDFKILEMDNLGNFYLVNKDNHLLKVNEDGETIFEFSIRGLGELTTLDVSNPQKLLLYFSQYQNIIFLDNTLSEIKRLNLEELGYWNVPDVAISRDNNIWIYDSVNNRILKINSTGAIQLSSNELFNRSWKENGDQNIFEHDHRVFLYNEHTVIEFDDFGEETKTYNVENKGVRFGSESLYFLKNQSIYEMSYMVHFSKEKQWRKIYEGNNLRNFVISGKKIWVTDDKGLFNINTSF